MAYYFAKTLKIPFEEAIDKTITQLHAQGFGVLTTIDVQETLKQKLGVNLPRYTILGACNPSLANEALQMESKIGTMLPCNVVVREDNNGDTEVAAVDPVSSMQAVDNPHLAKIATAVQTKLASVIDSLN